MVTLLDAPALDLAARSSRIIPVDAETVAAFADLKALTPIILNAAARHHPKSGQ